MNATACALDAGIVHLRLIPPNSEVAVKTELLSGSPGNGPVQPPVPHTFVEQVVIVCTLKKDLMKAVYENHYLTDRDVANFARQSFAKLADHFTEEQNHNLIKFLARGMSSGDWEKLLTKMQVAKSTDEVRDLACYLRKIPEHWVPFGHPHISIRMQAPVPIARQC